jgi:hypothetical protein
MRSNPAFEVRGSTIHGFGVFATRNIRKGSRVIEYLGERISTKEADRRYGERDDNHVVLFTVDSRTAIDGGVNHNEARYINHSCSPNAQAEIHDKRVFIVAIRTIKAGEEITYDYNLESEEKGSKARKRFACLCGSENCRGTMLRLGKKR